MIPCQRCNKARATVHLVDIDPGGDKHEHHLCNSCAASEGITAVPNESVNAMLQKFLSAASSVPQTKDIAVASCSECGMTFREFRQRGLLGCAKDYEAFAPLLGPLIERAHEGATEHLGKVPAQAGQGARRRTELLRLRRQLSEAVERENYESAATLRDQIEAMDSHDG